MNVDYLNAFKSATQNVIETMAQMPVRTKSLRLNEEKTTYGEVTGVIGLSSKALTGSMVISFTELCILRIVSKMTMEPEKTKIDQDIVDAVGELTNMISGGVKNKLGKINMKFDLALPTMIVGKGVQICYRQNTPVITIPFMTEAGEFVVEANLNKRM